MKSIYTTLKNGLTIHSLIAGNPDNPPLVLLHGYPVSCYLWRHCIPALSEHFHVYAPDLPGHGDSDKPLDIDYNLDFFVDFLVNYYAAMGLASAALAAHDLGGNAALGFVSRHPERVSRFIIMDTAPYIEWPILAKILVKAVQSPAVARLTLSPPVFSQILKRVVFAQPAVVTKELLDLYRKPWVENPNGYRLYGKIVSPPPEALIELRRNLQNIAVPTLILWAEKDPIFPAFVAKQLHQDIPDSQLEIVPNCGHFLQEEEPGIIVEKMIAFLPRKG